MTTTRIADAFPAMGNKNAAARKRRSGFTLIEVIAVLVVLGILAAIALPRYVDLAGSARDRAIDAAIAELNGRESLVWARVMLDTREGFENDAAMDTAIKNHVDYNTDLGEGYNVTETSIVFQNVTVPVERTSAGANGPAVWERDTTTSPNNG